jgi:tRNA (cmo5U34)-methyltransferase
LNCDQVFERTAARASNFRFDEEVAAVFDDMLVRSVPFYLERQSMIREIGRMFWVLGTDVYDLGCSTATTLIGLADEIPAPARLIGYDSSGPHARAGPGQGAHATDREAHRSPIGRPKRRPRAA